MTVIETKNLGKMFRNSATPVWALRDVNLSFQAGQFTIIKGPSGSGKTTLLSIAGCILSPSIGEIYVLAQNVQRLSQKELQWLRLRKIGFIFQNFNLLEALTVRENVTIVHRMLGHSKKESNPKADALLEQVGLSDRLDFKIKSLSHGEKQRVAIARALMNDPEIILSDEPTANLDSENGRAVLEMLRQVGRNATVIIATHDERILQLAQRIIFIDDGKIVGNALQAECLAHTSIETLAYDQ